MKQIYHIEPVYKSFIWGGQKLAGYFRLPQGLKQIGTIYHVIAIPGHLDNLVRETGEPLSKFYQTHPELFCCARKELPVRMTTTCNEGKQSFQLHPTNEYALAHDGELGKVSGSVALETDETVRTRLFGNVCKSREELIAKIRNRDWEHLFGTIQQKNGDFLHTPAGVIHGGAGDGTISCVFSSNGDLTYRFYDYGRDDPDRPLALEKVFECANIPEVSVGTVHVEPIIREGVELLEYYCVPGEYVARRINAQDYGSYICQQFYFLACVAGQGTVDGVPIDLGETLFVPANSGAVELNGPMDLISVSYLDV